MPKQPLHCMFQAKAATLTIAQGFSLAYQSWQANQVEDNGRRKENKVAQKNEAENKGTIVVTEAVVEKQPAEPDEPISSSSKGDTKYCWVYENLNFKEHQDPMDK